MYLLFFYVLMVFTISVNLNNNSRLGSKLYSINGEPVNPFMTGQETQNPGCLCAFISYSLLMTPPKTTHHRMKGKWWQSNWLYMINWHNVLFIFLAINIISHKYRINMKETNSIALSSILRKNFQFNTTRQFILYKCLVVICI